MNDYTNLEGSNQNSNNAYDYSIKSISLFLNLVILVGDSGVGKSSILSKWVYILKSTFRYIKGIFPTKTTPTIALEFCAKLFKVSDGSNIKVQIWDTAGQEKYKAIVSQLLLFNLIVTIVKP